MAEDGDKRQRDLRKQQKAQKGSKKAGTDRCLA